MQPTSTYRLGYKGQGGYWRCPRSECCGALVVRFHDDVRQYVLWSGIGELPPELRCQRCNRPLVGETDHLENQNA